MAPKVIFIIPYRNREEEKNFFSIYMNYILEDYNKNDYEIYFSHQCIYNLFNRGASKNIGFLAMKEKYPNDYKNITFVFNDIDIMPVKKNFLNYITKQNIVKHFYGFKFALGGIVSITGNDFEKINGYSNNWGWGFEDNLLNDKCLHYKITIDRSVFYNRGSKEFIELRYSSNRIINNNEPGYYLSKIYDDLKNIKNLKYNITDNNIYSNIFKKNNEYIINITQFDTLIKHPNNDDLYIKDTSGKTTVTVDALNKNKKVKFRFF